MITVVVCTKDRPRELDRVLDSLVMAIRHRDIELLIIDNGIIKVAKPLFNKYSKKYGNLRYIQERVIGFSSARNRGWKEAKGEYIAYIDDDAVAYFDWIDRILNFIKRYPEAEVFGGPYERFSLVDIPNWIPDELGTMTNGSKMKKLKIGREWLSGTNMILKKSTLKDIGGFSTKLGVPGKVLGYGEETELQIRLAKKGIDIYYDPSIKVKHLLDERKMSLSWLLRNKYILGKTMVKSHGRKDTPFYHMASFTQKLFYLFYYLLKPQRIPVKRRIYYAFGGIFSAGGAFENYIYSKVSALKNDKTKRNNIL